MRYVYIIIFLFTVGSCSSKQMHCEAFDFKKIPYDSSYYYKNLKYVNDLDTITLFLRNNNHSKESVWGSMGASCNPSFELSFHDIYTRMSILYSFEYFDMDDGDTSTHLSLYINSGQIELNLDTLKRKVEDELTITKIHHTNKSNYSQMIRKIKFRKMKITEIETFTGIIWRLI